MLRTAEGPSLADTRAGSDRLVAVHGAPGVVVPDGAAVPRLDRDHLPRAVQRPLLDPAMPSRELGEILPVTRFGDVAGEPFDPAPVLLCQSVEEVGVAGCDDNVRGGRVQH